MLSIMLMTLSLSAYGAFGLTAMMTVAHVPSFTRSEQLVAALMMTLLLGMATALSGLSDLAA